MSNDFSNGLIQQPATAKTKAMPWSAWTGVAFVIGTFVFSQLLSSVILAAYASLRGYEGADVDAWFNTTSAQFAYYALTATFVVGAVGIFLRQYKQRWDIIGLRRPKWSDLGYALLAAPVYLALYVAVVVVVSAVVPGFNIDQEQELGFDNVAGFAALTMVFISLVILPPIAEEIMMRGLLYGSLKKALPLVLAVIITSIIFAIAHLPAGGAEGPLYIAAIDTFILSLVLIYLREKTNGLWSSIYLHALKNGIAFTFLFIITT